MTAPSPTVQVWSLWQRMVHWGLALCILGCWWFNEGGLWHEVLGYAALAIALMRAGAGLAGPREWRFSRFVRAPGPTLRYAADMWQHRAARHLNHNPLGAWMIVALLASALIAGASGALYDTDRFWGDPAVWAVHQASAWAFVFLVPLHIAGVWLSSRAHTENLLLAMITGRKRAPGPGEIG